MREIGNVHIISLFHCICYSLHHYTSRYGFVEEAFLYVANH